LWLALAVTAHQVDCLLKVTTEAYEDTLSSSIILGSSWSFRCLGNVLARHLPLDLQVLRITLPCTLQSPMTTTPTVLAPRGGTVFDCHSSGGSHAGLLRCSRIDVCPDCQWRILPSVAPRRLLSSDCYTDGVALRTALNADVVCFHRLLTALAPRRVTCSDCHWIQLFTRAPRHISTHAGRSSHSQFLPTDDIHLPDKTKKT